MLEFSKQEIGANSVLMEIESTLRHHHIIPDYTIKNTLERLDLAEISRHFAVLMDETLFVHYDVMTWVDEYGVHQFDIQSIGAYETFQEWEVSRVKELHSAVKADIPNIN